jgi:hypothetical protein
MNEPERHGQTLVHRHLGREIPTETQVASLQQNCRTTRVTGRHPRPACSARTQVAIARAVIRRSCRRGCTVCVPREHSGAPEVIRQLKANPGRPLSTASSSRRLYSGMPDAYCVKTTFLPGMLPPVYQLFA